MGSGNTKNIESTSSHGQTTTANILNTGVSSSSSSVPLVSILDEPRLDREKRISKLFCEIATLDETTCLMTMKPKEWDKFIIHCFIDDDCVLRERVRNTLIFLIYPDRYPHMERTIQLPDYLDIVENEVFKELVSKNAKAKFAELDVDKSGTLESREIKRLADWILEVEQAFAASSKTDVKTLRANIMKRIDFSKDGQITFDEFCVLFEEVYRREVRGSTKTLTLTQPQRRCCSCTNITWHPPSPPLSPRSISTSPLTCPPLPSPPPPLSPILL